MAPQQLQGTVSTITTDQAQKTRSIEFFHIYTDEEIGPEHTGSLERLASVRAAGGDNSKTIIMIDNYNPTDHILSPQDVFDFLDDHNCKPDYWAFEGDLTRNAAKLLADITNGHLQRNYQSYIAKRGKYPCSLLTAAWYLTRLGALDVSVIKKCAADEAYVPAAYLTNILPEVYTDIEKRAHQIIANSKYSDYSSQIEAEFYSVDVDRSVELV